MKGVMSVEFYDIHVRTIDGKEQSMAEYKNKVLLIVNTASNCGFTSQYKELEELYQSYRQENFIVLGFPCNQFLKQEPGSNAEIQTFCQLNYGVSFPMFEKIKVRGDDAHPLFQYLTSQASGWFGDAVKWNFTKFLVDRQGKVRSRYAPTTNPHKIAPDIEKLVRSEA